METKTSAAEDVFSKFINKARKKLSKKENEEEVKPQIATIVADYKFVKSTRASDRKKLEAKIKDLLKNNPNASNPIEELIDHTVYDKLSPESKTRYILQLSNDFNEIKNNLKSS